MIAWRRQWHPTPVPLPGKSHGRRSLVGCSPWGRWGLNTTERLHFHFSLSCIGEENGNPLQCSCLENPRDGGAWWAAVYGVTQSQTRLKWLSSSSSSSSSDSKCENPGFWLLTSASTLQDSLSPQGMSFRDDIPKERWSRVCTTLCTLTLITTDVLPVQSYYSYWQRGAVHNSKGRRKVALNKNQFV